MTRRTYLKRLLAAVVPASLPVAAFGCGQAKQALKCSACSGTGRCQECLRNTYIVTSCPRCHGTHKCNSCGGEGW